MDRLGATRQYTYNALRQKVRFVNPRGHTNTYDYCLCGPLDSVTDPLGKTTTFEHDFQGRLRVKVFPGGHAVTNHYDLMGRVTNVAHRGGANLTNWFNNQGRHVSVSNRLGRVRHVVHDVEDHPAEVVDANSVTKKFTYDALGRVIKRADTNSESETFSYSSAGLIAHTDQATNTIYYGYDAAGRKIAETNGNGEYILYSYSPAGDLIELRDAKGNETWWGYDVYGRVTSKTNASGTEILRYQYDANGRLTNRWSLAKGNTGYAYDLAGNLTNIHYPSGSDTRFDFDANNRMTKMVDAVGTTTYSYTDFGAVLSEDGPWTGDTVSYTYATNQIRAGLSLTQPNASPWEQTYGYDEADRLTSLTSPAGAFSYLYHSTSQLQVCRLSLPSGCYITNTFDGLGRLTGTWLKNSFGTTLNSHAYQYDWTSRRIKQTRTDGSYVNYGYDAIGQLRTAFGYEADATARLHERFGYTYDAAWNLNRRTNNALVQTFNVDNQNQLTTAGRSGTLTVAGTTTSAATNVTVNSQTANRYADSTFAKDGFSLTDGTNSFTAVAQDSHGRTDTNTVTTYLPASVTFTYDGNGNLRTNGTRVFDYDDCSGSRYSGRRLA